MNSGENPISAEVRRLQDGGGTVEIGAVRPLSPTCYLVSLHLHDGSTKDIVVRGDERQVSRWWGEATTAQQAQPRRG